MATTTNRLLVATAVVAVMLCSVLRAENWTQWRGPAFNGSSPEAGLPGKFSKTENVCWSLAMPGRSAATPIIWEERVFATSADSRTQDLIAYCLSRKDGKILWQKKIAIGTPNASPTGKNSWASPSAVTDGKRVWFSFGSGDIAAFDMDGKELWSLSLSKQHGPMAFMHGYSSTPLLYKDKLFVALIRRDQAYGPNPKVVVAGTPLDSYLIALDPATGKELWKQVRATPAKEGAHEAYTSPMPNADEIVMSGADCLTGHSASGGEELWRWEGIANPGNNRTVVSALVGEGIIYTTSGQKTPLYAVKTAGAKGTIAPDQLAFKFTTNTANCCCPLLYDGKLYALDGAKSVLTCLDPKTGETKWSGSLGVKAAFSASPTGCDGRIFCISEAGDAIVLAAGNEFKILFTAPFDEVHTYASISVAHKQLFIRTGQTLYCIGK